MESDIVSQALIRIEVAFAKGVISELEAAVCLAGYEENCMIKGLEMSKPNPEDILHPEISKLYEIIISWPNVTRQMPFLWYIEQAVTRNTPYVRYDLVLPRCKGTGYRQKEIIKNYLELAKTLSLTAKSVRGGEELKAMILKYADEEVAKLQEEGKIKKISQHAISPYVVKRLAKDNIHYDQEYVRSFLVGWQFKPKKEDK